MLNIVHCQRIGRAVDAARSGKNVALRCDGSDDTSFVVWMDANRHVIAAGSAQGMRRMLIEVEKEFARQMDAALERLTV